MRKGQNVYFIDLAGEVSSNKISRINRPTKEDARQGALELIEFPDGFSTTTVYETEDEAKNVKIERDQYRERITKAPVE